jgi:Mce-associated membrane protein
MSLLLRRGIAGVLGLLIVLALCALGYQAVHRGGAPWRTANPSQDARDSVMGQARAFMKRVNTYGPDLVQGSTMPTYRTGVEELVTAKFKADFEQNVPYAEATVTQTGLERETTVYAAGVGDLDLDRGRATVLVAGELTNSFADAKHPDDAAKRRVADPQPYRVEVALVRQGGRWKVDDFTPVGAEAQQQVTQ